MKYRKYIPNTIIIISAIVLSGLIAGCSTVEGREPASVQDQNETTRKSRIDGEEPHSMQGDIGWLNEVEERYQRISAEAANRGIASAGKAETLIKQKNWTFTYQPKTNNFFMALKGETFKMVQTQLNDGERYAFAAETTGDKPATITVSKNGDRNIASNESVCDAEISYWNKKSSSYTVDRSTIKGKTCSKLLAKLKDYVP